MQNPFRITKILENEFDLQCNDSGQGAGGGRGQQISRKHSKNQSKAKKWNIQYENQIEFDASEEKRQMQHALEQKAIRGDGSEGGERRAHNWLGGDYFWPKIGSVQENA